MPQSPDESFAGSLKKLRQATVEEIEQVPGFGLGPAQAVRFKPEAINLTTGEILD